MRQKLITRTILLTIAVTGVCLVLLASMPTAAKNGSSEESMENCAKKEDNRGGGVIWENISHQFFSSF